MFTAPKLRERLVETVDQGRYQIIVNLQGVSFMDSTGLGTLVGGLKRVKAHRESGTTESIELRAYARNGELTFEIVDSGKGIDTEMQAAVQQGAATPAAGLYEGSLGLALIRSLFPGAEISRNDDRGTTV